MNINFYHMIIFKMNTDTNTVPILNALCRIFQFYFEHKISGTNISSKNLFPNFTFIEQYRIKNCLKSPEWDNLLSLVTFNISYVNSVSLLRITYNNPEMLEFSISGNYPDKFTTEIKTNIANPDIKKLMELCQIIESLKIMFNKIMFNNIMPSDIKPAAQVVEVIQ